MSEEKNLKDEIFLKIKLVSYLITVYVKFNIVEIIFNFFNLINYFLKMT